MRRWLRAPLWFHLALAALVSTIAHLCGFHELEASPVTFAFLGWIVVLAEAIWTGVQAATTAVVAFLSWAVNALFFLGQLAYNALIELGHLAMSGLRAAWRFFRWTYDQVLAPAWRKLWHLVDVTRRTLERVLRPVFKVLRLVRDELLHLYTKWVRPVLDTIETARKIVRVLKVLHVPFAAKLDRVLGELEEKIDRPFRVLLAKVNEVINFVNRIATANGLFQRLALVRSIERDVRYVSRAFINWRSNPLTEEDYERAKNEARGRTIATMQRDTVAALEGRESYYTPIVSETAAQWELYLRSSTRAIF